MDDLISRQAAIEALAKAMPSLTTPDGCGEFDHEIQIAQEAFVDAMQIIHELPSAQPELIEKEAYIRGFEQGRTQGMIDTKAEGVAQPTADMVEVVRCKDCKYRSKEWYEDKRNKDGGYWLVCCENDAIAERVYGLAQDNDYCSFGEREDT